MGNSNLDLNIDRKSKRNTVSDIVSILLLLFLVLTVIFTQTFSLSSVIGNSMQNTIQDGDYVICVAPESLDYDDIVIADTYSDRLIIKRIVGKPGDKLFFKATGNEVQLYRRSASDVSFEAVDESDHIKNGVMTLTGFEYAKGIKVFRGEGEAPDECIITLGQSEYFLMGDNRDASSDSREYGPFDRSRICNKICRIVNKDNNRIMYGFIGFLYKLLSNETVDNNHGER